MSIHARFSRRVILTRKVGQSDLVFGVWWRFISRSVYARLQVSVCSGCDGCCILVNILTDGHTQWEGTFWQAYIKSSAKTLWIHCNYSRVLECTRHSNLASAMITWYERVIDRSVTDWHPSLIETVWLIVPVKPTYDQHLNTHTNTRTDNSELATLLHRWLFNPLRRIGVRWLHFKVFSAIRV